METIKIKYFTNDIVHLEKLSQGDWIDLRTSKDIELHRGEFQLIPLGVGMILPEGYEAHIVPRSSTFMKYGIIQTNHVGIIDNSYSGEKDEWKMAVYAFANNVIPKNTRICQFRIVEKQPPIEFEVVEHLNSDSRGGFGSTGSI